MIVFDLSSNESTIYHTRDEHANRVGCVTNLCFCFVLFTVNGAWSEWSKYGSCSVSCGGGTFSRTRACDNPAAAHGGIECEGTNIEHAICNTHNCPSE